MTVKSNAQVSPTYLPAGIKPKLSTTSWQEAVVLSAHTSSSVRLSVAHMTARLVRWVGLVMLIPHPGAAIPCANSPALGVFLAACF